MVEIRADVPCVEGRYSAHSVDVVFSFAGEYSSVRGGGRKKASPNCTCMLFATVGRRKCGATLLPLLSSCRCLQLIYRSEKRAFAKKRKNTRHEHMHGTQTPTRTDVTDSSRNVLHATRLGGKPSHKSATVSALFYVRLPTSVVYLDHNRWKPRSSSRLAPSLFAFLFVFLRVCIYIPRASLVIALFSNMYPLALRAVLSNCTW